MNEGEAASLTALGLSADADRVWQLLLRSPDLDLAALRAHCGLGGDRAEEVLHELRERRLVEPAATALGVAPVDPSVAVEHTLAVEQRELAARLSQLSELRAYLPTLARAYAQGRQRIEAELPIEVVEGLEATRDRLLLLARRARLESLSLEDHVPSPAALAAARADDEEALRRGVGARTIFRRKALDEDGFLADIGARVARGEQVRLVDEVPARMLVSDREVVVIPLDAEDVTRGAIFVRVRTIVDLCVFLFERLWAEATPLFVMGDEDAPSGRAARVLELMAAGRKDETIARALGVGVRTVRRDIAALMSELGEQTRAATVAAAIRRGWLST